jgi:hypothetical protein
MLRLVDILHIFCLATQQCLPVSLVVVGLQSRNVSAYSRAIFVILRILIQPLYRSAAGGSAAVRADCCEIRGRVGKWPRF